MASGLAAGASTFQPLEGLGERRVSYARNDIVFEGGTRDELAVGRRVSVTGELSADGTLLEARRIEFDD